VSVRTMRCTVSRMLTVVVLGCAEATEPQAHVRPELDALFVNDFFSVLRDSGFVEVLAVLSDSSCRPAPHELVRVELTTTSGDSERLDLHAGNRGIWEGALYDVLLVGMRDGHSVAELAPVLEMIPARFHAVGGGGRLAEVAVLRSDRVVHAIRRIGAQPGVQTHFPHSSNAISHHALSRQWIGRSMPVGA